MSLMVHDDSVDDTDLPATRWRARLARGRAVFRAFRQTRPFWGSIWMLLAGLEIMYWSANPITVIIERGWSAGAGFVLGGILVVFALVALFAPLYSTIMGLFAVLVALVAFPMTNLGGFMLGSVLGIVGGAMVWSWGEKRPKGRGRRRAVGAGEPDA